MSHAGDFEKSASLGLFGMVRTRVVAICLVLLALAVGMGFYGMTTVATLSSGLDQLASMSDLKQSQASPAIKTMQSSAADFRGMMLVFLGTSVFLGIGLAVMSAFMLRPLEGIVPSVQKAIAGDKNTALNISGSGDVRAMQDAVAKLIDAFKATEDERLSLETAASEAEKERAVEVQAAHAEQDEQTQQHEEELRQVAANSEARSTDFQTLEKELSRVISGAHKGDFSSRVVAEFEDRAIQDIKGSLNELLQSIDDGLRETMSFLDQLSTRDLTVRMNGSFKGVFATLQKDANHAATQLDDTLRNVTESASEIATNITDISAASQNLSQRTESTAGTLQETVTALDQLTASVQMAEKHASEADDQAKAAIDEARKSDEVVRSAIDSMGKIERYSNDIAKTIEVLNEIAFQTNLLALNAGVEAARAGESGRGFAVVAAEVRALAQRASDSAAEIEQLITDSSKQVEVGVGLVGRAGEAITSMGKAVQRISDQVSSINDSAKEQSMAIGEINSAANQIDSATQQNAAMFEETTASVANVSGSSNKMLESIGVFRITGTKARGAASAGPSQWDKTGSVTKSSPVPKHARPKNYTSSVSKTEKSSAKTVTASAPASSTQAQIDDNWDEF